MKSRPTIKMLHLNTQRFVRQHFNTPCAPPVLCYILSSDFRTLSTDTLILLSFALRLASLRMKTLHKSVIALEQFFVDGIVKGGSITYNEEDENVRKVVEASENAIRKLPYHTPDYTVENGVTLLETPEGPMPIEVFGKHNLSNLAGAKWICQNMGVDEDDFYEAIATFKGASKRLEKIANGKTCVAYKDFAHSPSKVAATTKAVKEQFPDRKLIAFLELHTYSSFNPEFLKEYKGALDAADIPVVFYLPESVAIKKLAPVSESQISEAFERNDLTIVTDANTFKDLVYQQDYNNSVVLFMSSGNYGGLDLNALKIHLENY